MEGLHEQHHTTVSSASGLVLLQCYRCLLFPAGTHVTSCHNTSHCTKEQQLRRKVYSYGMYYGSAAVIKEAQRQWQQFESSSSKVSLPTQVEDIIYSIIVQYGVNSQCNTVCAFNKVLSRYPLHPRWHVTDRYSDILKNKIWRVRSRF